MRPPMLSLFLITLGFCCTRRHCVVRAARVRSQSALQPVQAAHCDMLLTARVLHAWQFTASAARASRSARMRSCVCSTRERHGQESLKQLGRGMRAVECFAGCGGTTCGLVTAGFDVRLGVDHDAAALAILRANHGHATRQMDLGDVECAVDAIRAVGPIELLCGSPPSFTGWSCECIRLTSDSTMEAT